MQSPIDPRAKRDSEVVPRVAPPNGEFRPEIQALRALAVVLVVLFHLWPTRLAGGFVGVDVFFAISGFLITGHLLREVGSGSPVHLGRFWARRIRRLLPAAFLVLVASSVATVTLLPYRVWQDTATQIGASALGIQNWVLASNAVDYFAVNNQPSIVQHFWSLSLEEQFYVFWPVLLASLALIARRTSPRWRISLLAGGMMVVFTASLTWSAVSINRAPIVAYFSTFTHAWEFAGGGLLALGMTVLRRSRWSEMERVRAIFSWLGLGMVVFSALTFSGKSSFPGWIALLPVGGALLVIAAGVSTSRIQSPLPLKSRPVQFIGSASYSIYLWHWPLIVTVPYVTGNALGTATKFAILVVSITLGWLTKVLVEDSARKSCALNARTWVNYAVVAVSVSALVLTSTVVWNAAATEAATAQREASRAVAASIRENGTCFGAAAMAERADCPTSHRVTSQLSPNFATGDWGSIAGVKKDGTMPDQSKCVDFSTDSSGYLDCTVGQSNTKVTVAVVGDSHALALMEPIVKIAEKRGWKVRAFLKNSCTASLPMSYGPGVKEDCNRWRSEVALRIGEDKTISTVVTTGFTRGEPEAAFLGTRKELIQDYSGLWERWTRHGKRVFVIEDVPLTSGQSVPDCVAAHIAANDPCSVPRASGLAYDPVIDAVTAAASARVSLISTRSAFCDAQLCHSVIGGVIAYRDPHHLSATFALTLVPRLDRALSAK